MESARDTDEDRDVTDAAGVTFLHGQVAEPRPLPRGQHDLSPEYVAHHQRTRILDATTHVLNDMGYGAATIGDIVARAHVSRRTFYAHFDSKQHCMLATFGAAMECVADAVRTAYRAESTWELRMAAGLTQMQQVLAGYPQTARTLLLEIHAVGPPGDPSRRWALKMCTEGLRQAVADRPGAEPVSEMALELGMGGLITVLRDRATNRTLDALQAELPDLTMALVGPLSGREAAEAVIERLEQLPPQQSAHAI